MRYCLYLYKDNGVIRKGPLHPLIRHALLDDASRERELGLPSYVVHPFDVEAVVAQVYDALGDKCKVKRRRSADKKAGYVCVVTSVEMVGEVAPVVHGVAAANGLVMLDRETERALVPENPIHTGVLAMKPRAKLLNQALREHMQPIWKFRSVTLGQTHPVPSCVYAITIRKKPETSFEQRAADLFYCLKGQLAPGERLVMENRQFVVSADGYSIHYILEGYKDEANLIATGNGQAELLHRMSFEKARKWLEHCGEDAWHETLDRAIVQELVRAYPNPVDRLVKAINIEKQLRKERYEISYSSSCYHGSGILFRVFDVVDYGFPPEHSGFKVEESEASFLLAVVAEYYPYIYERYYDAVNLLPMHMFWKIVQRMKEVKHLLIHDTSNEALLPLILRFDLSCLAWNRHLGQYDDGFDRNEMRNEPVKYLYKHRYAAAHLYDLFITWAEVQLDIFPDCYFVNIQGM